MVDINPRIAAVSDVSLRYGNPQVESLSLSLARRYRSSVLIFEPDESGKPPLSNLAPELLVERVGTTVPPFSFAGRVEYLTQVARRLNKLQPEMIVIFCTYCLPVLTKLKYKPKFVIYVSIESIAAYGEFDVKLNRYLAGEIDLVIFPEENRARLDGERCGLLSRPTVVSYNVRNTGRPQTLRMASRKRRVLYSGTIDRHETFAGYFTKPQLRRFPIDMYGKVRDNDPAALERKLQTGGGEIRYCGFLPAEELDRLRRTYAYSLVMWAPRTENQLYAAPNKFFEAIADGVPPIAAPHPQCEMLINRYECGILMEDWSFKALVAAIEEAFAIFGAKEYQRLVDNCQRAVECELSWDCQFAKVEPWLPQTI